jgi:hypothetical protein
MITLLPANTMVRYMVSRALDRLELAVRVVCEDTRSEGGEGK